MTNKAIHAFGTMLKMGDGAGPVNSAVHTVTVNATGGTYKVSINGVASGAIAYNAAHAAIQTALEAISGVGSGQVTVTDDSTNVHRITLAGTLANTAVVMSTDAALLTGGTQTATLFEVTHGSPGETYMTVAELRSIPVPELNSPRLDVSTHDNAAFAREYINNMVDYPAVSFEINYLPNDPSHDHRTGLLSLQLSGRQALFKVVYNSHVVPPVVLTFPATISSFKPAAPVDNVYTSQVQLQPTSAPTYAAA